MTAVGSLNGSFASPNRAAETSGVLYVPRVEPLDGALGAFSFFTRLLKNPLRILPTAAYEEGIVWAERAGRLICWITDPALIKSGAARQARHLRAHLRDPAPAGSAARQWRLDRRWGRLEMAASDGGAGLSPPRPLELRARHRRGRRALARGMAARPCWRHPQYRSGHDARHLRCDLPHAAAGRGSHVGPLIGRANVDYQKPLGWQMAYANFRIPAWMPHPGWLKMHLARRRLRSAVASLVAERRAQSDR